MNLAPLPKRGVSLGRLLVGSTVPLFVVPLFVVPLFFAISLVVISPGCKGETPQSTLDYSPENVELIRKIQGLEVPGLDVEQAAQADGSQGVEDGSQGEVDGAEAG